MQRFKLKSAGRVYTVTAENEGDALRKAISEYQIHPRKLEYITAETVEVESIKSEHWRPKIMYSASFGSRDYTVEASSQMGALRAFALMGLDVNKLFNLRKR